jgi:uridine kinase
MRFAAFLAVFWAVRSAAAPLQAGQVPLVPVVQTFLSAAGPGAIAQLKPENQVKMQLLLQQGLAAGAQIPRLPVSAVTTAPNAAQAQAETAGAQALTARELVAHFDAVLSAVPAADLADPAKMSKLLTTLWDGAKPAASPQDLALVRARNELASVFPDASHVSLAGKDPEALLEAEAVRRAGELPGGGVVFLEAPTAAGKSTLANGLKKKLGERLQVFPMDLYFKSLAGMPLGVDGNKDFDQPESLFLDRAAKDIETLLAGGSVELPAYDWVSVTSRFDSGEFMKLEPGQVLLIDSIYAAHPLIRRAARKAPAVSVFMYAPAVVRLMRRLRRDRVERGLSMEKNLGLWGNILHDEAKHVLPYMSKADLILDTVSEADMRALPEEYAKLLAQEPSIAAKLKQRIAESLAADAASKPRRFMGDNAAVERFLRSTARSAVIDYGPFIVTLRQQEFNFTGHDGAALTITSIESRQEGSGQLRAMLASMEAQARKYGFKVLVVEGEDDPRAWKLLERLGFKQTPKSSAQLRDYFKPLK